MFEKLYPQEDGQSEGGVVSYVTRAELRRFVRTMQHEYSFAREADLIEAVRDYARTIHVGIRPSLETDLRQFALSAMVINRVYA